MKIQSNLQTKHFANQMNVTEAKHSKAARELATGKKVNTAADDAVALSISEKLLKEAKTLRAGSNNISYGINAANIADGAMASIADSLGDIEENTVRAMNGLYSESDRQILQTANEASVETIKSSINQATYNEKKLLDGSAGDINIFTGSSSSQISEMDAKAAMAGLENFDISGNPDNITKESIDSAYSNLSAMRSKLGAEVNGFEHAYNSNLNTEENVTAAISRKVDAEMNESVTRYKSAGVVGAAQNMAMKNQMDSQESLVNRLMQ
ncbi:MAG: flagellin [Pseudobutyrivibrio sp.]|nr:flagellin [Pseudobutyrivibrio sp.]